jgi:hypothetical protein
MISYLGGFSYFFCFGKLKKLKYKKKKSFYLKKNPLALSMCFDYIQNFIKGIDPKKYWFFN